MSERAIKEMPGWKEPLALNLLTEFMARYRRMLEYVVGTFDVDHFEPELHHVIQAFVDESRKPWLEALAHAAAYQLPRGMMLVDKATLENLPPIGDQELWRGQQRGVWYRVVLKYGYKPELQVSFNASLGEEHEVWQVQ